MKKIKKLRKATSNVKTQTAYLTKRDVVRVATAAIKRASTQAMKTAGYVIKAENGWVVRENQDGRQLGPKGLRGYRCRCRILGGCRG